MRVHGVPNLRVVDLSVCPQIASGNTNAPAIMLGERGADFILGKAPLVLDAPAEQTLDLNQLIGVNAASLAEPGRS